MLSSTAVKGSIGRVYHNVISLWLEASSPGTFRDLAPALCRDVQSLLKARNANNLLTIESWNEALQRGHPPEAVLAYGESKS